MQTTSPPVEPQLAAYTKDDSTPLHSLTWSRVSKVHVIIGQAFLERCVGSTASRSDEQSVLGLLVACLVLQPPRLIAYTEFFYPSCPLRPPRLYVSTSRVQPYRAEDGGLGWLIRSTNGRC